MGHGKYTERYDASKRKTERRYEDGFRTAKYDNGPQKDIFPDGRTVVRFANGDVKKTFPKTGIMVYYFAESKATQTSYPDRTEVFEFPNGQIEKHFESGAKEIHFPGGDVQY